MKNYLIRIALAIVIVLGLYYLVNILYFDIPKPEGNPLNPGNFTVEKFRIDPTRDTLLESKSGSLIVIPKNAFAYSNGSLITSPVSFHYREFTDKSEIILAGLTTLNSGRILESGGMVYTAAFSGEEKLTLSEPGKIGIALTSDSIMPEMQVFQGSWQNHQVNWKNPEPLLNEKLSDYAEEPEWDQDIQVSSIVQNAAIAPEDILSGQFILTQEEIEAIGVDSTVAVPALEDFAETSSDTVSVGNNYFLEDIQQKYVFKLAGLGWANIDRLFYDPRSENIELITKVTNYNEFGEVFISLVFKEKNIYLPGYQKKDMTYSFTHGDYEKTYLPVGADVVVVASASKNGLSYFAVKKFTLSTQQTIQLELVETDIVNFRSAISTI